MFGGSSEANGRRTSRLIALDLVCANGYGLALANSAGLGLALRIFAAPVALLTASAVLKRRNAPRGYALCHGAWHLASAAGMWVLLRWRGRGRGRAAVGVGRIGRRGATSRGASV